MKRLKWTGISLAGLVGFGLIAYAIFVWLTGTRLERQLAAIRAAGDPVTLADLARPPIPPEKNAATFLRRANADMAAIEKVTMNLKSIRESADEQKAVKTALAAYPNVIPLLEQAAACPDYDAELDYSLPAKELMEKQLLIVDCRSAARVLNYRSMLLVAEGKRDEAVRTALVIFRLARHFDRNPTIVGYLVAIAVRGIAVRSANDALQAGPVSKEVREALDAELATQERMEGFVWAMKSERCCGIAMGDELPGGSVWLIGVGIGKMWKSAYLDMFPTYISLAGSPAPFREIEQAIDQTIDSNKSFMNSLLQPAIKAAFSAVARTRASIRCLRVLNALQTHAPSGSKEAPKLTELGLPAETIADPFTGEPLHVKKTPQGWLVYSVGPNYRDDGGKLEDPRDGDVGVGPPTPVAKP
jgi:hypothetical protein